MRWVSGFEGLTAKVAEVDCEFSDHDADEEGEGGAEGHDEGAAEDDGDVDDDDVFVGLGHEVLGAFGFPFAVGEEVAPGFHAAGEENAGEGEPCGGGEECDHGFEDAPEQGEKDPWAEGVHGFLHDFCGEVALALAGGDEDEDEESVGAAEAAEVEGEESGHEGFAEDAEFPGEIGAGADDFD